ncbi:MAG: NAD(P)-binding domain-containing protein, partial [Clostridia bacterium]|nr:NAD(P)-binding domain-containing protein [Clostridia bacterium]
AQIVLANKGFFAMPNMVKADYKNAQKFFSSYKGNYKTKVGILGDGAIGSQVIDRLKAYRLEVYVYSIQMTEERAKEIGVKLSSLQEIFAECDVISNHLANNEQTKGIINAELIKSMKDYSTFINTGRGAQVDENALIEKLSSNPTVTAVLDVTCPEPPEKDSPLYTLNNVFLTPHIAGSSGNEVWRMAEYMLEESKRFVNGDKSLYEVSLKMLETMA